MYNVSGKRKNVIQTAERNKDNKMYNQRAKMR